MKEPKHGHGARAALVLPAALALLLLAGYLAFRHFYGLMDVRPRGETAASDTGAAQAEAAMEESGGAAELGADETEALRRQLLDNLMKNAEEPAYDDDVYNLLLLGNDSRENGVAERTDAMILVSVNRRTRRIVLTSFLRDIYLYIPDCGFQRLNAANVFGGADMTAAAIEQNFGVPVHNCAQVDFYAFIDIADALGGVDVELSEAEIAEMNEKLQEVNWYRYHDDARLAQGRIDGGAGRYHLDGAQTLAYCRVRYADSDFGRSERQQRVLEAMWESMKELSLAEAYKLLKAALPAVTTDLTEGQCLGLLLSAGEIMDYELCRVRVPQEGVYEPAVIEGMSVLSVDVGTASERLRASIYGD